VQHPGCWIEPRRTAETGRSITVKCALRAVSCGLVGVATNAEKALGEASFAPIFKLWRGSRAPGACRRLVLLCFSLIESRNLSPIEMAQRAPGGVELDGQLGIDLLVERAAAGEAPSSPQPPEAGARRARLYSALSVADHRNRETMPSGGAGVRDGERIRLQPTLNMWPTCPWRRGADWLRASARSICLSRICERTAPRCLFSTMVACETCRSLSKVV